MCVYVYVYVYIYMYVCMYVRVCIYINKNNYNNFFGTLRFMYFAIFRQMSNVITNISASNSLLLACQRIAVNVISSQIYNSAIKIY